MMLKKSKLTNYQIKKIIECFFLDLTATQTAKLLQFNRKTINNYYTTFRIAVVLNQQAEFQKFVSKIELDESYFGARRIRGFHGRLKRGRGTMKQLAFGIFKRNSRIYIEIVLDCKKGLYKGLFWERQIFTVLSTRMVGEVILD